MKDAAVAVMLLEHENAWLTPAWLYPSGRISLPEYRTTFLSLSGEERDTLAKHRRVDTDGYTVYPSSEAEHKAHEALTYSQAS